MEPADPSEEINKFELAAIHDPSLLAVEDVTGGPPRRVWVPATRTSFDPVQTDFLIPGCPQLGKPPGPTTWKGGLRFLQGDR